MKMWKVTIGLTFMAAAMSSSLRAASPTSESGTLLWDFRDPGRVAVPEMTMIDGLVLPDGSMAVLAMGDEWRGSLGLYRLGPDGAYRGRQELSGWRAWHTEQPMPAIATIESALGGPNSIVVGSHFGFARLPMGELPMERFSWIRAPFDMVSAVAAAADGSVWLGGTENERLNSSPQCSRAVIARYDGNDKRRWQWAFEDQVEAMFVRRIVPLPDGAVLALVSSRSPVGYGGGAIRLRCDEQMGHDWLVWVSADGRTLRQISLGHDRIEAMAVLPDGTVALADFTEARMRTLNLRLRRLSADGARTLIVRRYPANLERDDAPRVDAKGWSTGLAISAVQKLQALPDGFAMAVSIECEDCRPDPTHLLRLDQNLEPQALSAAWPGHARFLMGVTEDSAEYIVGGSAGVYRLKLP